MTVGTPDQWLHLLESYDLSIPDYSKGKCPKVFLEHLHFSIHGLVYFDQNTKQMFVEFPETKDAIALKQHQQFFLDYIVLIIVDKINVEVISITCIGFIQ